MAKGTQCKSLILRYIGRLLDSFIVYIDLILDNMKMIRKRLNMSWFRRTFENGIQSLFGVLNV